MSRLDDVLAALDRRVSDGLVIDAALRARALAQYDEDEDVDPDARVYVDWIAPRSADSVRKGLNGLERIARERWGMGLPADFRRIYEERGLLSITIRGRSDDDDDDTGDSTGRPGSLLSRWDWAWPAQILKSSWVAEPLREEDWPDGSHHIVYAPFLPFMRCEESDSEPVALVFRHAPRRTEPTVDWIIPGAIADVDGAPALVGPPGDDFLTWFERWIEAGFSSAGGVD
jgi:hypothetical protein